MSALMMALALLQEIQPLISDAEALKAEIGASISAVENMVAQDRDPTQAEIDAQTSLIASLQAKLAAGAPGAA